MTRLAPGDEVVDELDDPEEQTLAVVVNTPPVSAEEWAVDDEYTVAEYPGNEPYPDDDRVVCVCFGPERVKEEFPDWEPPEPIKLTKVRDGLFPFYTFPESRLEKIEDRGLYLIQRELDGKVDNIERRPGDNELVVEWLGEEFTVSKSGKVDPSDGLIGGKLADAVEEVVDP